MMASWRYLAWLEEMIFCKISRTLASVARICRRMEASSGLAESASSSVPYNGAGDLVLQKPVGGAGNGRGASDGAFLLPVALPVLLGRRGRRRSTPAMSSSSRVFRLPPMSARWREPATGLTPEKEGLPRSTISFHCRRGLFQTHGPPPSGSVSGRSRRARSLPSSVTAWSASRLEHPGQLQGFHGFFKQICHGLAPSLLSRLGRLGGARCRPSPAPPWCQVPR